MKTLPVTGIINCLLHRKHADGANIWTTNDFPVNQNGTVNDRPVIAPHRSSDQ